jgi:hypothetical protein
MLSPWRRERVLIAVRTYPTPASKGIEVSCTAGVTAAGKWIRLHPVPYRFLDDDKRFKKYHWIDVEVTKSSDPRAESHRINISSIKILGDRLPPDNSWQARKDVIFPLLAPSLCYLQRTRQQTGATLGIFKPKTILGFDIEPEKVPEWTPEEQAKLNQMGLFEAGPYDPLEKIPFKFYYRFKCDDPNCPTHRLSCADWEIGQAYRKWRQQYGAKWEDALRKKFEQEMIERFDTHFFVGTIKSHPHVWIIVGLFFPLPVPCKPPRVATQLTLEMTD